MIKTDKFNDLFEFRLPDGSKRMLTIPQARSFGSHEMNVLCDEILADMQREKLKKTRRDGFAPGWQPNIGMYVTCYAQYKRILRDRGLVETGYDVKFKQEVRDESILANPKMAEMLVRECGIDLTGREIEAIESGEYFKDSDQ